MIDGTLIEDAGLRLKGNSTLQSLRGGEPGPPRRTPPVRTGTPPRKTQARNRAPRRAAAPGRPGRHHALRG
ncbi:hypothetical protein ACFQXA_32310 [Nocardiopsis composta]